MENRKTEAQVEALAKAREVAMLNGDSCASDHDPDYSIYDLTRFFAKLKEGEPTVLEVLYLHEASAHFFSSGTIDHVRCFFSFDRRVSVHCPAS